MSREKDRVLFNKNGHQCIVFSHDDEDQEERYLSVNQMLITDNGVGILLDPGSSVAFDSVYESVLNYIDPKKLEYIFFSHQDPDVAGSITEWSVSVPSKLLLPRIWKRFVGHYGIMDMGRITEIEDEGCIIDLNRSTLHLIPAHFLHSPGNITLYDEASKILFSGDIGAAMIPPLQNPDKEIDDFNEHLKLMQPFHERYMAGNIYCKRWVKRVKELDIETIVPQHGPVINKEYVYSFLEWFGALKCGGDIM